MDIFKTLLLDTPIITQATGAVTSVFGRNGTVTAANGDYTASNITNVPAGNIAATEVQAAINELDGDKLAKASNLSDLVSASTARTNLGLGSAATQADTYFLQAANNLSDLASVTTARSNLGLGTMATQAASNVSITGGSISGITDLAVADGGTGASTASDARVSLLPSYTGNGTKILALNSGATDVEWVAKPTGDLVGPASATDNAIVRFDGTTGKLVQNSAVTIADTTGDISGVGQLNATTVDATNIEVTNIKAKDGTSAGSIADSTGVVTLASTVLTTTDINGGTIDGTAIGATNPSTVAATTLSASGAITPSQTAGIVGTTTNNDANAGSVGQYVESVVLSGSAISLTTATDTNLTSISLTAGDWDVEGYINYLAGSGTATTNQSAGLTSTSATMPALDSPARTTQLLAVTGNGSTPHTIPSPRVRFSLSATTTIYIVARIGFPSGTVTMNGSIRARRVR